MRIAVVGAGVFGCQIATDLAKIGLDVTLYESKNEIMCGATLNSQNRLHLGLHYPRDLATAIQSREGHSLFSEEFPNCVRINFPNYYAIAKENSKVSSNEFIAFANQAKIPIEKCDVRNFPLINADLIDDIWLCKEGVIDVEALRKEFHARIENSGVHLRLSTAVKSIDFVSPVWKIEDKDGEFSSFDSVIRCTYGVDSIRINQPSSYKRTIEYHHTMVLEVSSSELPFGITVVDGDFLTVLPRGFSNDFLLYAPSLSVRAKYTGNNPPENWTEQSESAFDELSEQLISRTSIWMPNFKVASILKKNIAIRAIEPNVQLTDRRISHCTETSPGLFDVWSGKIDHCIEISQKITRFFHPKVK
jgi:glycine/D-amino acid oxidase-like deaminating enzyme